jgi:hypothetical protein
MEFVIETRRKTMATQLTATVVVGLLKPDQSLQLADQTRVQLTIEPIEEWSPQRASAAWETIKAKLRERPLHFGGQRYIRDELHERD